MAVSVTVRLEERRIPSRDEWQEGMRAMGFPFLFDHAFDPFLQHGVLKVMDPAGETAFEYYCERKRGWAALSFVYGESARGAICAIVAAGCLCEMSGGVLEEDHTGASFDSLMVRDWVSRQEAGLVPLIRAELGQVFAAAAPPPKKKSWWQIW
jgi:hypothetical protein